MKRFLLFLILCGIARAQTGVPTRPDCDFGFTYSVIGGVISSTSPSSANRLPPSQGGGTVIGWDNRTTACTNWVVTYQTEGVSTVSIELDQAPSAAGIPGTWAAWTNTSPGTLWPLTTLTVSQGSSFGYQPWVSVNLNSANGTGTVYGRAWGWKSAPGQGGTGTLNVQGGSRPGTPETTNPIPVGVFDGTNIQYTSGTSAGNPIITLTDGTTQISNCVSAYGVAPTGTACLGGNAFITNNTLNVITQPTTAIGGATSNNAQTALTTAVVVKASGGNVYGAFVVNASASTCYLEFINASSAPSLGTNAVFSIPIPGSGTNGGVINIQPGTFALGNFGTGISVGLATAYNGNTACGSAGTATIFFK